MDDELENVERTPPADPVPLDYIAPAEDRSGRRRTWVDDIGVIASFLATVGLVAIVGAVVAVNLYGLEGGTGYHGVAAPAIVFLISAGACVGAVAAIRRKSRKYALIAMLLGVALMGLVEGICYSAQSAH
jgi:peptidoglycan/LPS O-acetylase OafA/YrhL